MSYDKTNCVLMTKDCFDSLVVFEKDNYDKHKQYHAELRQKDFCPDRVTQALQHPTFTIKGNVPYSKCYYLEEYSKNGIMMYTKVVLLERFRHRKKDPLCIVMTAHRTTVIKETNYGYKIEYHE